MAWITPIITWTPSPVSNADFNRIEGNTKYLREENKTINGTTTLTSLLTISSSGLTSSTSSIDLLKAITFGGDTQTFGVNTYNYFNAGTTGRFVFNTGGNTGTSNASLVIREDGKVILGGATSNGTDLLQAGSDQDKTISMGKGRFGYVGANDLFAISHYDNHNNTDCGLLLTTGDTYLNAKSGNVVRITNAISTLATFGASSIELKKDTTITGSLSVNEGISVSLSLDDDSISGALLYDHFKDVREGFEFFATGGLWLFGTSPNIIVRSLERNGTTLTITGLGEFGTIQSIAITSTSQDVYGLSISI